MKTVNVFEKGEDVFIRGKITEITMENGEIKYQVQSIDTGKNMGIWFDASQLVGVINKSDDSGFFVASPKDDVIPVSHSLI